MGRERVDDGGIYQAFLLRFTRAEAGQPWEMVARDVQTGEEYPVADVDALMAFLADRVQTTARRHELRRARQEKK